MANPIYPRRDEYTPVKQWTPIDQMAHQELHDTKQRLEDTQRQMQQVNRNAEKHIQHLKIEIQKANDRVWLLGTISVLVIFGLGSIVSWGKREKQQ